MNELSNNPENFVIGETRENMANLGGFRYILVEQNDSDVKVKVTLLGRAVWDNVGNIKDGDEVWIPKKVWKLFTLISVPGFEIDKIVASLTRSIHEIRGRLANIIGGATEKKNISPITADRLRTEINERCLTILMTLNWINKYKPAFELVMKRYIESETLHGRRKNRTIPPITGKGSDYEFIISLLEVAGTSRTNAERFFFGSLNRTIQKKEIPED